MASNEKQIIDRYTNSYREELRASRSRAGGLEFYYTEKILREYVTPRSSVIELGCGAGYYGLFLADKCASYHGVDITPANIAVFQQKIDERQLANVTASVGDATDLSRTANERYDVVLVFGPLYHLPAPEREVVFRESRRICKAGGLILCAYFNKIGAYVSACAARPEKYPNNAANDALLVHGVSDDTPEIHFFTMPEEIEVTARRHGLRVLKNVGVDFLSESGLLDKMTDEQFDSWLAIADYMHNSRSCAGFSPHAVLVCRRE